MLSRQLSGRRWGRSASRGFLLMLLVLFFFMVAAMRLLGPEGPPDPRSVGERLLSTLLGVVQCFGLVVGVGFILALLETLKHHLARSEVLRLEDRLSTLAPLTRDARPHATPSHLDAVLHHLEDKNFALRHQAVRAAYCLLRADPGLAGPPARPPLERAMAEACGFAQTLAETPPNEPLLPRVTLGGKLGAGTVEKRLAPVTSDPGQLALWVAGHRGNPGRPAELQVSVGYDTGPLPSLEERARFLGLYLFICTTDLRRFQALTRRPQRDPNAAFGLVIRGDVIEPRYPGQRSGHRLDYVFPLPEHLSTANLTGLIRQIQLLNLGLLAACALDAGRVLLGPAPPPWFDTRRLRLARIHADFERRLVRLLRSFDGHRDPARIHPLDPIDHAERVTAFGRFRLEENLYPYYRWIVPLYSLDTRWERLLDPLRAVEGMLLHQGPADGGEATCGSDFIRQVRRLGYATAEAVAEALAGPTPAEPPGAPPPDPFIDPGDEEATRHYLQRVSRALEAGRAAPEDLPDPATFRQAVAYYGVPTDAPLADPDLPETEP